MPHNNPVVAALPIGNSPGNNADKTLLRNMLVQRTAYVVDSASDAADLVAVDPATGVIILVIICLGRNFLYDPSDTTSVHDGVSVLVTSDGKRYKLAAESDVLVYGVLDRLGTPPATSPPPAIGSAYLITVGATGAWAGHDNEVTVMTARGWEFIVLEIGRLVYVEDEDAYYRKKADGTVSIGMGNNAIAAGSILPSQLQGGGDHIIWSVVNQTTNTPPAVTNGAQYIIGSSPTGAWAGNPAKIAHGENGVWVIYSPANGWLAYDQSLNEFYRYNGSAWITSGGKMQMNRTIYTSNNTFSKNSRCVFVDVVVVGGSGGSTTGGGSNVAGGTSSFGAHCSATGGGAGTVAGTPAASGSGSGGDANDTGVLGVAVSNATDNTAFAGVAQTWTGFGVVKGNTTTSGANAYVGGPPGVSRKRILAASLGTNETVTVGAAGTCQFGNNGEAGFVVVDEWILT